MSVALKLFDNYYINTNFLPSSIQYEQFDIDFIDEYFVVSKTLDNQIISYYKDNIWDFTPYISNPSQPALFNFEKRIPKEDWAKSKLMKLPAPKVDEFNVRQRMFQPFYDLDKGEWRRFRVFGLLKIVSPKPFANIFQKAKIAAQSLFDF
jgi:hypothetical protein